MFQYVYANYVFRHGLIQSRTESSDKFQTGHKGGRLLEVPLSGGSIMLHVNVPGGKWVVRGMDCRGALIIILMMWKKTMESHNNAPPNAMIQLMLDASQYIKCWHDYDLLHLGQQEKVSLNLLHAMSFILPHILHCQLMELVHLFYYKNRSSILLKQYPTFHGEYIFI